MAGTYIHGYDPRENLRLQDQATTLVELLHSDTAYPAGSSVLEAGCGVGAQTVTLAAHSPNAHITSIDVSETSVNEARKAVQAAGLTNVTLQQAVSEQRLYVCDYAQFEGATADVLHGEQRYITAPICHGTNSALPKPSDSDSDCFPDATAMISSRISAPFAVMLMLCVKISPQLISISPVMR